MNNTLNETSVDIVLPNYNSYPYLQETLESIVNQNFKNWKLFIVDGNSNIETQKVLKEYSQYPNIYVTWLKKNKKAGFCRNLIIRNCKSAYIAFIDSDDIWEKEKLSKQINFMINKNYLFTYTNYTAFKDGSKKNSMRKIFTPEYFTFEKFIRNTSIGTSTMVIKRSAMRNIKFSNTKICEDYFFKCQLLKRVGKAYCLQENLTKYRIRKKSLQSSKIRNFYWIWYINKYFNCLNFFKNFISILCISINSMKKYGFK